MPFLENVTRGRGIPRERLAEVGQHYYGFGGRSPINDQCRSLLRALRTELDRRGIDRPLYWGNRNWDPYLGDAIAEIETDGHRRVVAITTSAYPSYSSCRQYRENLYDAVQGTQVRLDKIRHYAHHPGFVAASIGATLSGRRPAWRVGARYPAGLRHPCHSDRDGRLVGATATQFRGWLRGLASGGGRGGGPPGRGPAGRGSPLGPGLLLALRSADTAVDRAGRERSPGAAECGGYTERRVDPDRLRLRSHGGHLRPRHGGGRHRASSVYRSPGRPRPARTRRSWRRWSI